MDGSKKKWLINRGGEILGPLSAEEILGGLHDGEFDPKMEIKAPGTGWRGMAHFPEVAGQLRSAGLNLQTITDTSTNTTAQLTGTTTVQDQTTTDPMDADDLPEATVVWPLKEKDLEPSVVQAPVRPPPQPGPVKTYQWEPFLL